MALSGLPNKGEIQENEETRHCRYFYSWCLDESFQFFAASNPTQPILPHSWFLGHIPILMECTGNVPKDTHPFRIMTHIAKNYKRFFPDEDSVPPVLYFDMWPLDIPFMMVIDAELSAQFTQQTSLPKHDLLKTILIPLTSGQDLVAANGDEWKFWRSRFNPGFSARNLMSLFPEILEEVEIFGRVLDRRAGPGNNWGDVFPFEEDAVSMTFDIIGRAVLYVHNLEAFVPMPVASPC